MNGSKASAKGRIYLKVSTSAICHKSYAPSVIGSFPAARTLVAQLPLQQERVVKVSELIIIKCGGDRGPLEQLQWLASQSVVFSNSPYAKYVLFCTCFAFFPHGFSPWSQNMCTNPGSEVFSFFRVQRINIMSILISIVNFLF